MADTQTSQDRAEHPEAPGSNGTVGSAEGAAADVEATGDAPRTLPRPRPTPQPNGQPYRAGEELPLGFWQKPWVQNVLPFVMSLTIHAAAILGILAIGWGVTKVVESVEQEQIIIPDVTIVENAPVGGIPNPGMGEDPDRKMATNIEEQVANDMGAAKTESLQSALLNSSASENTTAANPFGAKSVGEVGTSVGGGPVGGGLPFGMPGGGGGLGPKVDGPFGASGNARKIVFLSDRSGSMVGASETLIKQQLRETINKLSPVQEFEIIFFGPDETWRNENAAFNGRLMGVTPQIQQRAYQFADDVVFRAGTDPRPALEKAFALEPDLIFLITDGDFFGVVGLRDLIQLFQRHNPGGKTKVNTILLVSDEEQRVQALRQIAEQTGGTFTFVSREELFRF